MKVIPELSTANAHDTEFLAALVTFAQYSESDPLRFLGGYTRLFWPFLRIEICEGHWIFHLEIILTDKADPIVYLDLLTEEGEADA